MTPDHLAERWEELAATLDPYVAPAARAWRAAAAELRAWWSERELEALTLEQAAQESGYSYSALQKKVAAGELENVGTKGAPRVRRGELPRKGGRLEELELADRIIRSVA